MPFVNGLNRDLHTGDLEGADVATQQQLSNLADKIDQLHLAIADVGMSTSALVVKLESLDKLTDLRLRTLEHAREQANVREWVEKLVYAGIGAGTYDMLGRIFHHLP